LEPTKRTAVVLYDGSIAFHSIGKVLTIRNPAVGDIDPVRHD